MRRRVLLAVPGRLDRAFYKALVRATAAAYGLEYVDLDAREREAERERLLNTIAPQESQLNTQLRGVSVVSLRGGGGSTEVIIWPLGGEEPRDALLLLLYQLGLEEPTLDYLVVIRDSERACSHRASGPSGQLGCKAAVCQGGGYEERPLLRACW